MSSVVRFYLQNLWIPDIWTWVCRTVQNLVASVLNKNQTIKNKTVTVHYFSKCLRPQQFERYFYRVHHHTAHLKVHTRCTLSAHCTGRDSSAHSELHVRMKSAQSTQAGSKPRPFSSLCSEEKNSVKSPDTNWNVSVTKIPLKQTPWNGLRY